MEVTLTEEQITEYRYFATTSEHIFFGLTGKKIHNIQKHTQIS